MPTEIPVPELNISKSLQPEAGKRALVLAGGGVAGAVYEIGALRALDNLLVDHTVNDFDIYVGTSAGSLVAAGLANGIEPTTIFDAIDGSHPQLKPVVSRDLLAFDAAALLRQSIHWPQQILGNSYFYLRHSDDLTLFDLVWSLLDMLPSSLYDSSALENWTRSMLRRLGGTDRFDELDKELVIIATNLESGDRAVFNAQPDNDVRISQAVAASSAVPLVYKPVRIGDSDYVDGAVRANASLDLAVEQGASLVICINPLAPLSIKPTRTKMTQPSGSLSEGSMQTILNQVFRTMFHANLHYHIKHLARLYPQVDFILVEPAADDEEMSSQNIMRYSARSRILEHAFQSVSLHLAQYYDIYQAVLARHEMALTPPWSEEALGEINSAGRDPEVVSAVMENLPRLSQRDNRATPTAELARVLARLDASLGHGGETDQSK